MVCEATSERVNQNRLQEPEIICFVSDTKHSLYRFFLHFCFTRSLDVHKRAKKAEKKPAEWQLSVPGLLELPLFSVLMNVYEGYRLVIVIFALSDLQEHGR
jgi:hypothetical protein